MASFWRRSFKVKPQSVGLKQIVVKVHGYNIFDSFWYGPNSNIYDLQQHVHNLFAKSGIKDDFKLAHVSNRFHILNADTEDKLRIKICDLDFTEPNFLTAFPREFLLIGGGFKGKKCGKQSKHTMAQQKERKKEQESQWKQNHVAEQKKQKKIDNATRYQQQKKQILKDRAKKRAQLSRNRRAHRCAQKEDSFEDTRNSFRIMNDFDENDPRFATHYLGKMNHKCKECDALMFEDEKLAGKNAFGMCCGNGKIKLPKLKTLPTKLTEYLTANTKEARYFRKNICKINAAFCFASMGSDHKTLPGGSFKIQGQVCHRMNETFSADTKAQFASIYFYDNEGDKELTNRMDFSYAKTKSKIAKTVFKEVQKIIHDLNPFYKDFKNAIEQQREQPLKTFQIILQTDIKPEKAHKGCYNAPTSVGQVAAVIPGFENEKKSRDIVLYCKSALDESDLISEGEHVGKQKKVFISEGHSYYDPVQYVTMFPYGTLGWAPDTIYTEKGFNDHMDSNVENVNGENEDEEKESEEEVVVGSAPESQEFVENLQSIVGYVRTPTTSPDVPPSQKKRRLNEEAEETIKPQRVRGRFVNCRKYHKTRAMVRGTKKTDNSLHRYGKLWQQYMVDSWAKVESNDLNYIRHNQKTLRSACISGLEEAMDKGEVDRVGKEYILPASHTGSVKWFHSKYQDAMSIVQEFKKPDLFITFTTNPKWFEIEENLFENQTAYDRPDIVARVFELKKKELLKDLYKRGILGRKVAHVHTVEFQKRGLPHIHILIILDGQDRVKNSDDYDSIVSAEIPDKDENPRLYALVMGNMIHYHTKMCWRDGCCTKNFPKDYANYTSTQEDGYPEYKRRSPEQGGAEVVVTKQYKEMLVTNGLVVPYNPGLLLKYNCHINVEICSTVRSVKYLYKYVYKGADRSTVTIERTNKDGTKKKRNEIKEYIDCRYISSIEAAYRLFECSMHGRFPSVQPLYVHLPNQQQVRYDPEMEPEELERLIANSQTTMFTQWFANNLLETRKPLSDKRRGKDVEGNLNPAGPELFYHEYPRYYRWKGGKWERRKDYDKWQIGRMHTAHPSQGQRWFLRILLNHVQGPTGYLDLLNYEGTQYTCFKERCMAQELLEDDREWDSVLNEAKQVQSASQMRRLFVNLLMWCEVLEPDVLWTKYRDDMIEDIEHRYVMSGQRGKRNVPKKIKEKMYNAALYEVCELLEKYEKDPASFKLVKPDKKDCFKLESREILVERQYSEVECQNDCKLRRTQMNKDQKEIYDDISDTLYGDALSRTYSKTAFFIDAPGGTGKTFVCNALLSLVRGQGEIALACASSGIAATNFKGGRTVHSRFKVPIPITATSTSTLTRTQRELLHETKLIIWDEAPMQRKEIMENVDRTLRDVMKNNKPFGGKVVVFCGDFRQVAPVIPRGGRAQIIAKCISNSKLWQCAVEILNLTFNERLNRKKNVSTAERKKLEAWNSYILQVGEDRVPKRMELIKIPTKLLSKATTESAFIDETYGSLSDPNCEEQRRRLLKHAILTPKNVDMRAINNEAIKKLRGKMETYESINTVAEDRYSGHYTEEYLQSLEINNFPTHNLQLKIGAPIMVLRNIDPLNGVCNGTKGIVTRLLPHLIEMETTDTLGITKKVLIHRISLQPSDPQIPIQFRRRQFPITLSFAMTINKSQGQTLDKVGLYLPNPVFGHGQLYVALSRVTHPDNIKLMVKSTEQHGTKKELGSGVYTRNIVYSEILSSAGISDANETSNVGPRIIYNYEYQEDEEDDEAVDEIFEQQFTSMYTRREYSPASSCCSTESNCDEYDFDFSMHHQPQPIHSPASSCCTTESSSPSKSTVRKQKRKKKSDKREMDASDSEDEEYKCDE